MRKDLTIYTLAILLGFVMGLFTCKTCSKPCPAAVAPSSGEVVKRDTTTTVKKDSSAISKPVPERITLPTLATGRAPVVFDRPVPVYMPADTVAIIEQYKALYADLYTRRDYRSRYPFGGDTVEVASSVQGNELWEQEVILTHAERTVTQLVREKARNQVWWGASSYWREGEIGVGSSLMFVHKKGVAFEAGADIGTSGMATYRGGIKWPISFRR